MIFFGVVLQYFGPSVRWLFMKTIVSITAFIATLAFFFKLNWLALFDPTEPDENKSTFLAFFSCLCALMVLIMVHWAMKKFLRFGPAFIGCAAGLWFSLYLISAINGIGGMGASQLPAQGGASYDIVGPMWAGIIQFMLTIVGGLVGYQYSYVFVLLIQTFISAYLIVRGSTLIINLGFPNELVLIQSVSTETNGLVKLPLMFYLYSIVILGIWGGSFYHQFTNQTGEDPGDFKGFDDDGY